mmetsp:Transcript_60211/g.97557  ORF Transcript_60211/g.97557 Transcript_60211/m.97557 type:complete len:239 (-) Transcript_60211:845-1561(-)
MKFKGNCCYSLVTVYRYVGQLSRHRCICFSPLLVPVFACNTFVPHAAAACVDILFKLSLFRGRSAAASISCRRSTSNRTASTSFSCSPAPAPTSSTSAWTNTTTTSGRNRRGRRSRSRSTCNTTSHTCSLTPASAATTSSPTTTATKSSGRNSRQRKKSRRRRKRRRRSNSRLLYLLSKFFRIIEHWISISLGHFFCHTMPGLDSFPYLICSTKHEFDVLHCAQPLLHCCANLIFDLP